MRARDLAPFMALTVLVSVLFSATGVIAEKKIATLDDQVHALDFSKAVPGQLNYQGFLVNADDSSAVTATLEMTFRLYDSETEGTELWSETHSAVEVGNGLFQVLLGSMTSFPSNLFDGPSLWLQTQVGSEILAPRKPLASVAYSQRSETAAQASTANWATEAQHAVHADTADYCPGISAWTVDGDNIYRETGKVGIGTASPIFPLHVDGPAWIEGLHLPMAFGPDTNFVGEDGNWIAFGHPGTSEDFLGYKGNALYFMDSPGGADTTDADLIVGGRVGIGTMSPSHPLDVSGAVNATTYYGDGSNLTWISGTADADWTISGSDIYSGVSGNVGIGTISPEAKLHIHDDTGIYAVYAKSADTTAIVGITGDSTGSTYAGYFEGNAHNGGGVYAISAEGIGVYGLHTDSGPTSPGVYGRNLGSGPGVQGQSNQYQGVYGISSTGEGVYAYNTFTDIYSYLADTVWAGYFSGDAHISGNVGIGTTTPTAPLTIEAVPGTDILFASTGNNADIVAPIHLRMGTNNGHPVSLMTNNLYRMTVLGTGQVGIGTTSPVSNLEVEDANPDIRLDAAVGGTGYLRFSQDDTQKAYVRINANGDLQLDTSAPGAAGITILNSDVYVGIGTETPARTLHVGDVMRLEPTTAPSSPSAGDMYIDSGDGNKLKVYDGTVWRALW
jgi:hypothetical protein